MYVERIKYQSVKDGEWKVGYYIGADCNADHTIILNSKYQPVEDIWDYKVDYDNRIIFSVREKEHYEWE